jgi:hypothetical protein
MNQPQSVSVNFNNQPYNTVFISSAVYPATLGSARAYDAKCNGLASAAGINNGPSTMFFAWMSDNASNAVTQLSGARGFTRVDGLPFSDTVNDITSNHRIMYPISLDENGAFVPYSAQPEVWTGTLEGGTVSVHCTNWTGVGSYQSGTSQGGPSSWTAFGSAAACNSTAHVYCFQNTRSTPLTIAVATGKLIYAAPGYVPSPTAPTPDTHCNNNKPTGSGAFKALISTTSAPAANVLVAATSYVNKDGQLIGTGAQIASGAVTGALKTGLWVGSTGNYISGFPNVWTGSPSPTQVGTLASTCNNWTGTAGNGTVGEIDDVNFFWNWLSPSNPCNAANGALLYCVEQ